MTVTLPTTYVVHFDRIGRHHPSDDETFVAVDSDDLAEQIWRRAGRSLGSRSYSVVVDLETGKGSIESGRFGSFTVRPAEAP